MLGIWIIFKQFFDFFLSCCCISFKHF